MNLLSVCAWSTLAFPVLGCQNVERFDNQDGSAYCGSVVDASFVRQGFAPRTRLQLRFDVDHLSSTPGTITSDDEVDGVCAPAATFDRAELRTPSKLSGDPLSLLNFGEAREANLLAWVDSTCDGSYLAVISLMKYDDVEVRLLKGERDAEGTEVGPFGVFHLERFARASCFGDR
jgi:hypothetical protein